MNWTVRALIKRGQVKLIGFSPQFLFFEVKEYSIRIAKQGQNGEDNCTCQSGSIWRVGKSCNHIDACRAWLKGDDLNG